ncbi:MAG: PilZ domain-containing protein [Lachnospiraceae bacterium]|jgi:Predicted glycosyltransferase
MPSETVWGIYMLNGLVDIGSKVVFYKNIFQSGSEDLEKDRVCQCKLHKVLNNSEITVIDDDDGKTELMKHECYTIDFYSKDKIFRCNAYFISDYNEDGYRYFNLEIISPFRKMQRRNYQRYPCHALFSYSVLQKAQIHDIINRGWKEAEKSFPAIAGFKQEQLADIGGGGIRFTSKQLISKGNYLLCILKLDGYGNGKSLPVLCKVVYSDRLVNDKDKFDIRMKYTGITEQQRKEIIHFVFWLERQRM